MLSEMGLVEMGTGKTRQAIKYIQENKEARPVIIVCELAVKQYWLNECNKILDTKNIQVIKGVEPVSITGDIIIIDYYVYWKHRDALTKVKPELMIFDESFKAKTGLCMIKR